MKNFIMMFFIISNTAIAQINIRRGCSWNSQPPINKLYVVKQAHREVVMNINKLLLTTGFKMDQIYVYESDEVQFALAGVDSLERACILINTNDIGIKPTWLHNSIIAHELGHVYKSHIFKNSPISRETELDADYYSGFLLRKIGCPSLAKKVLGN